MAHRRTPEAGFDLDDIWYYIANNSGSIEIADHLIDSMGDMQAQIQEFISSLNSELALRTARPPIPEERNGLIPVIIVRR
jgi:hypothetical protein